MQRAPLHGPLPKTIWLRCGNCSRATIESLLREHHAPLREFLEDESGRYKYLQIVHKRVDGKMRQRDIASLGRVDKLQESGQLDRLTASIGRSSKRTAVLSAHRRGLIPPAQTVKIGPELVFGRLWQEVGIGKVLGK